MDPDIMKSIASISTPLGVSGIAIIMVYGIYKAIIKKDTLTRLREKNSFRVLELIIRYIFILAIVVAVLGIVSFTVIAILGQSKSDENRPVHEVLYPQTSLLFPKQIIAKDSWRLLQVVDKPIESEITIISSSQISKTPFPSFRFTLMNRSKDTKVVTKVLLLVVGYEPFLSIPNSRALEPLVVWDIVLPYSTGTFSYTPASPVLLASNDAVSIDLRFLCISQNVNISPYEAGHYKVIVRFVTDQGDLIDSKTIRF